MATNLRERKRAAVERELASTAFTLVRTRGFPAVTIDDVVEAVGVSRRTFSNYYSCKEDAVAAVTVHRASDGLEAWHPGPGASALVPVVRGLVQHQFRAGTFETVVAVTSLARDHHQLVPFLREAQWRLWSMAATRVLDELGQTDPTRRGELTAIMGALFGVVSNALLPTDGEPVTQALPDLQALVAHVLDSLETGFGA